MRKRKFLDEEDDLDIDMDEFGGYKTAEAIVKRCKCGYRGELVPDINGYSCANCGYLLVDNT